MSAPHSQRDADERAFTEWWNDTDETHKGSMLWARAGWMAALRLSERGTSRAQCSKGGYCDFEPPCVECKRAASPCVVDAMTEERARTILGDTIQADGGLYCLGHYTAWTPGDKEACLDCNFAAEELEAIAFWMKNAPTPNTTKEK